jgi:hypothetical protein
MAQKPHEPVRARTPYMFFVRDSREYVKKNKKEVQKRDIMLEVGKMWSVVKSGVNCPGVKVLSYYQDLAYKDLDRFKTEHAEYVNIINQLRHRNIISSEKKMKQRYGTPPESDEDKENTNIANLCCKDDAEGPPESRFDLF